MSLLREANTHRRRVERALFLRCRRGQLAALATLAYRLMDRLYTAASLALPDEASAQAAVLAAWEALLAQLARPHMSGSLRAQALRLLEEQLLLQADPTIVAKAIAQATDVAEEELVPLPEEAVALLVDAAQRQAPLIAGAYHDRQRRQRRLLHVLAVGGLGWLVLAAWRFAGPAADEADLPLKCLQQRIVRQELIESLQTFAATLPDPQGADQPTARLLQQASLALEEILNARGRAQLRYIIQRLQAAELAAQLGQIATEYPGAPERELMLVQLALEEIEGL